MDNSKNNLTGYATIDRPWEKHFSKNAKDINLEDISMYDYMVMKADKYENSPAINYYGRIIKYNEVLENTRTVAKALKVQGVKKGDNVVTLMPSDPEAVYVIYALNRIGAVVCPIDPRTKSEMLHKTLKELNPKLVISLDMCSKLIKETMKDTSIEKVVYVSALESLPIGLKAISKITTMFKKEEQINDSRFISWKEFLNSGKKYEGIAYEFGHGDDLASIIYTGGTTGVKKGVEETNYNINAMVEQHLKSGIPFSKGQKFLDFLPPFIVYGLVMAIHMPLSLGFETTMVPIFEPKDFPKLIFKTKSEYVFASPVHYEMLLKYNGHKDYSFLKVPVSGGDSMPLELENKVNEDFKKHNAPSKLGQGLGMSEAGGTISVPFPGKIKTGSVGLPFPNTSIGIFDVETGKEVKYNELGEICFSGPSLMKRYYNNETETKNVLKTHEDGLTWLHTGDIGYIDNDGYLYHVDRMKRIINRGGLKVFPSEVEKIIKKSPSVLQAVVVSMDNETERHVPIAHIIIDNNTKLEDTLKEILNICSENLYPESIPFAFKVHDSLPYTSNGKIDYKTLESDTSNLIYSNELNHTMSLKRKK